MLKIVMLSGNSRPVSYPVDPHGVFEAGMIAQLKVVDDEIVVGVSDGTAPLGIIDDYRTINADTNRDTTSGSGRITIWLSNNTIFRTDQFDTTVAYPLNGNLYCGADGKLTTLPNIFPATVVGMIMRPPTALDARLDFIWRL